MIAVSAFVFIERYGNTARYVVGSVAISVSVFFAYRAAYRVYKNSNTIQSGVDRHVYESGVWWFRPLHAFVWFAAGVVAFAVHTDNTVSGVAVMTILVVDVLLGIFTAVIVSPFGQEQLFERHWSLVSLRETADNPSVFTAWTLVHVVFGTGIGAGAYYAFPSDPWVGCIIGSALIFLWEAFENSCTVKSGWLISVPSRVVKFMLNESTNSKGYKKTPDSAVNLAGDVVIGLTLVWSIAYILSAVG